MGSAFLEIQHLYKTFHSKDQTIEVLRGINLTIKKGDIFGIIGFSGAGKSTLIRCINRLEEPDSGSIKLGEVEITTLRVSQMRLEKEFEKYNVKTRILNGRLASIIAEMRHVQMLFIGDAGNGTSEKWLYPLDSSMEYMNLSICSDVPRFKDVVMGLCEAGQFEAAIVAEDMPSVNPTISNACSISLAKPIVRR